MTGKRQGIAVDFSLEPRVAMRAVSGDPAIRDTREALVCGGSTRAMMSVRAGTAGFRGTA